MCLPARRDGEQRFLDMVSFFFSPCVYVSRKSCFYTLPFLGARASCPLSGRARRPRSQAQHYRKEFSSVLSRSRKKVALFFGWRRASGGFDTGPARDEFVI